MSNWLNRRLVEAAVKSRYFSSSSTGSALAAAATSQSLPSTLVELEYLACAFGGQTTYLRPRGFEELLLLRAVSATASGPPVYYSLRKATVEFWPAASGGELLTYYGAAVPDLWAGTAASGLPEPFGSTMLVNGACIDAADFKSDPKLLLYYQGAWAQGLRDLLAFLNLRVSQASRAFPVYGPDGRPFSGPPDVPHDPSSDFFVTGYR